MNLSPLPELSVVIVNYNSIEFTLSCLFSLYDSNGNVDTEVIVVDNCSHDDNLNSITAQYPQTRLIINKKNIGFASACNKGLRRANGKFILLLNPDTFLPPDSLRSCINYLTIHEDIGLLSPKLIRPDGSLDWACRRTFPRPNDLILRMLYLDRLFPNSEYFSRYALTYSDPNQATEVDCVSGAFMLARREALNDVGLLDEQFFLYFEDLDWSYRFRLKGWKVLYYPNVKVLHYKRGSTKRDELFAIREFYRALYQGYFKYYGSTSRPFSHWLLKQCIRVRMNTSLAAKRIKQSMSRRSLHV